MFFYAIVLQNLGQVCSYSYAARQDFLNEGEQQTMSVNATVLFKYVTLQHTILSPYLLSPTYLIILHRWHLQFVGCKALLHECQKSQNHGKPLRELH